MNRRTTSDRVCRVHRTDEKSVGNLGTREAQLAFEIIRTHLRYHVKG